MMRVEEALKEVLNPITSLEPTNMAIGDTLNLVLAQTVKAPMDLPRWDNSGMDGYAVRASDIVGASKNNPKTLPVIGEIAAGSFPGIKLDPKTAIRIMTGAPIPVGADTIVRFEDTDEEHRQKNQEPLTSISILKETPNGEAIREQGEDIKKDDTVFKHGTPINPGIIGVLASLGLAHTNVVRRPRVAILSTGDEIVQPGKTLGAGQIFDSNSHSLAALINNLGAQPEMIGIAKDTVEDLSEKIAAAREYDLVLTSAGVSLGYYDIVKEVLKQYGDLSLWTVRMRPGKPVAFGMLKGTPDDPWEKTIPLIGLPGNPVSAMVVFYILARPAILKMMGYTKWDLPSVEAILEDPIVNFDQRRTYARALVEKKNGIYHARLAGPQGSNILTGMARANGLAICPENTPVLNPGDKAEILLLE
ncbi:MAG: molybdopterin molybdotransferase MoeA [SAR202 cluster bacterium]|nr:molybdopterin molybdotransferase MoeA [SAR202 cluster bacterium]|tara:strand:+ start:1430 stop:2683 length:1254 start_codon:yes stop_codon:yes gene_type:complete